MPHEAKSRLATPPTKNSNNDSCQELPRQTPARRAKGSTHSELPRAACRASQHQIRHVCTRDEQNQADNYEADHYFGARPSSFRILSVMGADEPSQVGISFRKLLLEMGKEGCRFRPSLF